MAEVLVADGGVLGEFLAGALEKYLALEQQVGPVGVGWVYVLSMYCGLLARRWEDLVLVEVLPSEDEVVAEVLVADGGVLGKFLAGALEKDLALEQQVGPVSDA